MHHACLDARKQRRSIRSNNSISFLSLSDDGIQLYGNYAVAPTQLGCDVISRPVSFSKTLTSIDEEPTIYGHWAFPVAPADEQLQLHQQQQIKED